MSNDQVPSFLLSHHTAQLIDYLAAVEVGEFVRYEVLTNIVGIPVSGATAALTSARHILLRDRKIVFDVIRGLGLKRLDDLEIVGTSARTRKKIRRAAHRGMRVLSSVEDFSALPLEAQQRHSAASALLGAVAQMSGARQVESKATTAPKPTPVNFTTTFDMFRRRSNGDARPCPTLT